MATILRASSPPKEEERLHQGPGLLAGVPTDEAGTQQFYENCEEGLYISHVCKPRSLTS